MHRKNAPGVFQLALMGNSQKALDEQVIKAYHFIQSFAPTDEVTPEEAHQIGMDFMKKTFDDRYAFLCSTHVDKNHIHNHFVMCSASRDMSGRKLDDNLSLLHSLRKNNDILCKENGLGGSGVFCFPVRFVHCKYNTPILKKEYSKPTTFLPKTYRKPAFLNFVFNFCPI